MTTDTETAERTEGKVIREEQLPSLLITAGKETLVVPASVIAEIIPFEEPAPVAGYSKGIIGNIIWRGQVIPVVSFEQLRGELPPDRTGNLRLGVFYVASEIKNQCRYFAVVLSGIPRSVRLTEESINMHGERGLPGYTKASVVVGGLPAIIPDLEKLEELVLFASDAN